MTLVKDSVNSQDSLKAIDSVGYLGSVSHSWVTRVASPPPAGQQIANKQRRVNLGPSPRASHSIVIFGTKGLLS